MKKAKTVRLRVSFEYEVTEEALNDPEYLPAMQRVISARLYQLWPKRLRVERVEKPRGKR